MEKDRSRNSYFKFALIGLATGLYPILFYYTYNFTLINSWKHFGFFLGLFVFVPVGTFILFNFWKNRTKRKINWQALATFINSFLFLNYIQLCLFAGIQWWVTLIVLVGAVLLAYKAYRHLRKIVVFQFLLASIALFTFIPRLLSQLNYSDAWMLQMDDIEQVTFKKKPNVYYIQPDGYVNFSEIGKGHYQVDNTKFEAFLKDQGFKNYDNFRSNYTATLESNSATFVMKHHYYNNGFNFSEIMNARETIITKNPVLDIFKNNGYITYFLPEIAYLLTNFPDMGYDYCNFSEDEISLVTQGLQGRKEVFPELKNAMEDSLHDAKFFFIEIFSPGHVNSSKSETKGQVVEKENYLERLWDSNRKLEEIITYIRQTDPEGLILIMADHGGYVGFDYMLQLRQKQHDRDLIYSGFSSQLSIYWPEGTPPDFDDHFKTTVNTFRLLFTYLSGDVKYLNALQEDASYSIILDGATKGVYKLIDEKGDVVFEKVDK